MKRASSLLLTISCLFAANTHASIILESNYVKTAISDNGTLGYGSTTSPGLLHDATGTGNFGTDDYLTPGHPWEYFGIFSNETGNIGNNNSLPNVNAFNNSSLVDSSAASAYDNEVIWRGSYNSLLDITTRTYFNDDNEYISFTTSITALADLTSLSFLRAIDPDMPADTVTRNERGYGALAASDWVNSENLTNGLTLGLYSVSDVTHNTGVTNWTTEHTDYLNGTDLGTGDYTIGMAFDIGTLLQGSTVSFEYHYVMGDTPSTVDIPTEVPEPATLSFFSAGLLLLLSRKKIRFK